MCNKHDSCKCGGKCRKQSEANEKADSFYVAAKNLGHTPQYKAETEIVDVVICSCGWESSSYHGSDGAEYAWSEWEKHAESVVTKDKGEPNFK
ncbi:MAG: hypothetical protein BMS9Abin13_174 [Patescibacteria group bacterium]|nr:MAG: hypothetical protein BMS9Abin13_174 [Patescibacteria group bacterium]